MKYIYPCRLVHPHKRSYLLIETSSTYRVKMAIVHQSTVIARVAAQKSADNGTGDRGAQVMVAVRQVPETPFLSSMRCRVSSYWKQQL